MRHILFRQETRWPGYYYRADFPKLDEQNWKAFVNSRYEEQRSIVLTTNLDRDELAEQINARTVSRLEEMCEELPLFGSDHRKYIEPDLRTA